MEKFISLSPFTNLTATCGESVVYDPDQLLEVYLDGYQKKLDFICDMDRTNWANVSIIWVTTIACVVSCCFIIIAISICRVR
jgi:hypothetical protein